MTHQAHPPTVDQQLADARVATEVAEQKAAHWQGVADAQRKEIEDLKMQLRVNAGGPTDGPWWVERPAHGDAYIAYGARGDLSETYDLMEAYNVDTDYELMARAPLLLAERDAARDALAGMVNQYMCFPEGYVTHEFMGAQEDAIDVLEAIGWLRAGELERYYWTPASGYVSSPPPTCPRCGAPLNNVSPGVSVVAGGVSVCTPCLRPGETEIARARGLTVPAKDKPTEG